MAHPIRWRAIAVTLLAAAFVASLTLRPARQETLEREATFFCLLGCGDQSLRDLLSNILLFLPIGWSLRHWTTHRRAVALALLITIGIETLQGTVITGRDASLRDILCNTAGAALGSWLFTSWPSFIRPAPARAQLLALGATLGWLAVLGATALGNGIVPTRTAWFGFWTPDLANFERFRGSLERVQLDDWVPANGPLPDPEPLRRAMRRDSFQLRLDLVTGTNRSNSLIFAVMDSSRLPQVMVGQLRNSLWMTWRTRFDAWDLRGNTVRIPVFPGRAPGSHVQVEAGRWNHALQLRATSGDSSVAVDIPETVGLGWNSLVPLQVMLSHEWLALNPLWLAGLVFPLAYWFGRGVGPGGLGFAGLAVVLGLWLVPAVLGAAATTSREWGGATAGAVVGCTAGLLSRRRRDGTEPAT